MSRSKKAKRSGKSRRKGSLGVFSESDLLKAATEPQTRRILRRDRRGRVTLETHSLRTTSRKQPGALHAAETNLLPPSRELLDIGNLFGTAEDSFATFNPLTAEAQVIAGESLTAEKSLPPAAPDDGQTGRISCHEGPATGNKMPSGDNPVSDNDLAAENASETAGPSADDWQLIPPRPDSADNPLGELLKEAKGATRRRGRPTAFDAQAKGKMVALLALGLSTRQAAGVIGVSHTTVSNALKANPALAEEINTARFHAHLQPLACVIRESRRSWKAATWLLKYLDTKLISHDETIDERDERHKRWLAGDDS